MLQAQYQSDAFSLRESRDCPSLDYDSKNHKTTPYVRVRHWHLHQSINFVSTESPHRGLFFDPLVIQFAQVAAVAAEKYNTWPKMEANKRPDPILSLFYLGYSILMTCGCAFVLAPSPAFTLAPAPDFVFTTIVKSKLAKKHGTLIDSLYILIFRGMTRVSRIPRSYQTHCQWRVLMLTFLPFSHWMRERAQIPVLRLDYRFKTQFLVS